VPAPRTTPPDSPPKDTVATVAAAVPATAWQPYRLLEGRKGPLVAELAAAARHRRARALAGPEVWLVLRRPVVELGEDAEVKYYLSNAPRQRNWGVFAWASGMRCRSSRAWRRVRGKWGWMSTNVGVGAAGITNMTLVILAHHFLVQQQVLVNQREGGPRRGNAPGRAQGVGVAGAPA